MKIIKSVLFLLITFTSTLSLAQSVYPNKGIVFNDDVVPRIDIKMNIDSLQEMLNQENQGDDHEYPADFYWSDGEHFDTLLNVGFRLRGNTSRLAQKKSFKVKFDKFKGMKFDGLSEMNLNGEHNDPSIIRSKLVWDLMRMAEIEAPRANHVRLYINGEYRGLYINVEHIDNNYLKKRNKTTSGQLYKCYYGCDLVYRGSSPNQYPDNIYEAANNQDKDDKAELIEFVKILNDLSSNDDRCEFERIFDVDRYLKIMALEILVGHWDNSIYNINNTYLYFNDRSQKLEIISYDTDNTFGIDWFDIDWTQRNIYEWSRSNSLRPLYNNVLKIPEYKARFGYYVEQYVEEFFNPTFMNPYIDKIRNKISRYVQNDYYAGLDYGYDFNDFIKSYNMALGDHVKNGLKEFIDLRSTSATSQLIPAAVSPFLSDTKIKKTQNEIILSFKIKGNSPASVDFNYKTENGSWTKESLLDNGNLPDTDIGDGIFTIKVTFTTEKQLDYFLELKDLNGNVGRYPYCNYLTEWLAYKSELPLHINEFMADNDIISDNEDEFEDWIELYNHGDETINLQGLYFSDDIDNPSKWELPDFEIPGKSFLVFWADEDQSQGLDHCNFKLSKEGEFIGLFEGAYSSFTPIDTFTYDRVEKNISYGRIKDGQGPISRLNAVTFEASNETTATEEMINTLFIFPNPATNVLIIRSEILPMQIRLIDINGKVRFDQKPTEESTLITVSDIKEGMYILAIKYSGITVFQKVLILH